MCGQALGLFVKLKAARHESTDCWVVLDKLALGLSGQAIIVNKTFPCSYERLYGSPALMHLSVLPVVFLYILVLQVSVCAVAHSGLSTVTVIPWTQAWRTWLTERRRCRGSMETTPSPGAIQPESPLTWLSVLCDANTLATPSILERTFLSHLNQNTLV